MTMYYHGVVFMVGGTGNWKTSERPVHDTLARSYSLYFQYFNYLGNIVWSNRPTGAPRTPHRLATARPTGPRNFAAAR